MIRKLIRVGNSVGVTIPKKVLEEAHLKVGDLVKVEVVSGSIDGEVKSLTKIIIRKYRPALEELAK